MYSFAEIALFAPTLLAYCCSNKRLEALTANSRLHHATKHNYIHFLSHVG